MASYYISNSGNDSNNGTTTGTPWQTIDKVNASTFAAGDQILFNKGDTFYGSLTINQSGTAINPIIIGAYGTGVNPIITGFTTVSAWTDLGGNIWESTSAVSTLAECNMVAINNVNTAMGRFPNIDANPNFFNMDSVSGRTTITSSSLDGVINWTGAEAHVRASGWTTYRTVITSQSGSTITIGDAYLQQNYGFFIQNDPRTLTQQNEWYYDPTTKKIKVYSSSQPTDVKVASVTNLLTPNGNYITIQNITFSGANENAINKPVQSSVIHDLTIKNCTIKFSGVGAINIRSNNADVEDNTITDSNHVAIYIAYSDYVTIKNNYVSNTGILAGMVTKVRGHNAAIHTDPSHHVLIEYNQILNTGLNAINFYGHDVTVRYNYINGFCQIMDDGGGIYTYTGDLSDPYRQDMQNVVVHNNIVLNGTYPQYEVPNNYVVGARGIYLDWNSSNMDIYNNTVYNSSSVNIHVGTGSSNIYVHNNVTFAAGLSQFRLMYLGSAYGRSNTNVNYNNNVFASKKDTYSLYYYFGTAVTAQLFGDYNMYIRPVSSTKQVFKSADNGDFYKTLAEWQAQYGKDLHSVANSPSFNNDSDIYLFYNETKIAASYSLPYPMVDATGIKYTNSINLDPFTSIILIKDAAPAASVPSEPLNVVATAGVLSATISFSPSISDGGAAITGYTVVSTPGNISVSGPGSPITVPNLVNGISYTFVVYATNSVGNSLNSVPSSSIIPNANVGTAPKLVTYQGKSIVFANKRIIAYL